MNKTAVVTQVSQKSVILADICEKVIKELEESGELLIGKFKGTNRTELAAVVSQKTNIALEDCEKVLSAFEVVLDTGLSNKLKFF